MSDSPSSTAIAISECSKGKSVRFVFLALFTLSLSANAAEVPSAQSIIEHADRGIAHIGRGRNLTFFSAGMPAPVVSGSVSDYQALIRRYREIAEQARQQQEQARKALAEAEAVKIEVRTAQGENQRSLADAQRRLEALSRDLNANPDEVRATRTALENEIAERTRANSDYEQQLGRMEMNESDLQQKIDQMEEPIRLADSQRVAATDALKALGYNEDGTPAAGSSRTADTGGVVPPTAGSDAGRTVPPTDRTAETDPKPRSEEPRGRVEPRSSESPRSAGATADANPSKTDNSGAKPGTGGMPDMSAIMQAMQSANQAEEQKKAAEAAAQLQKQQQQAALQAYCSLPINRSHPQCAGVTPAATAAATSIAPNTGAVRAADQVRTMSSVPGSQNDTVASAVKLAPRNYEAKLSKAQASRIVVRMAARVRDMSEPRKQNAPMFVPPLPSQRMADSAAPSPRGPASESR